MGRYEQKHSTIPISASAGSQSVIYDNSTTSASRDPSMVWLIDVVVIIPDFEKFSSETVNEIKIFWQPRK